MLLIHSLTIRSQSDCCKQSDTYRSFLPSLWETYSEQKEHNKRPLLKLSILHGSPLRMLFTEVRFPFFYLAYCTTAFALSLPIHNGAKVDISQNSCGDDRRSTTNSQVGGKMWCNVQSSSASTSPSHSCCSRRNFILICRQLNGKQSTAKEISHYSYVGHLSSLVQVLEGSNDNFLPPGQVFTELVFIIQWGWQFEGI